MTKKIVMVIVYFTAFLLPLCPQTTFEYNLSRIKANKVVLIGNRNASDIGKWQAVLSSDDIYIHGFVLLDRARLTQARLFGVRDNQIVSFEAWLRTQYGLEPRATWVALDLDNKLIASGIQVPSAKDFDEKLEQVGLKSPLRIVRAFLVENPDHLDAKADLLTEARRRA
jgi:hypothetical protein